MQMVKPPVGNAPIAVPSQFDYPPPQDMGNTSAPMIQQPIVIAPGQQPIVMAPGQQPMAMAPGQQ